MTKTNRLTDNPKSMANRLDSRQSAVTIWRECGYAELLGEPLIELYVFHADREELDIKKRTWFGIRGRA